MQLTHSQKLSSDLKNILNKMDFVGVELYSNRSIYFWSKDRSDRFNSTIAIYIDSHTSETMLQVFIHRTIFCKDNEVYQKLYKIPTLTVNEIKMISESLKHTISEA